MSSEMIVIADDSSCPTPEDILRRFHHSVHQHYESCASIFMDEMEYEDCSALASIGGVLLAGNDGVASQSFSMEASWSKKSKAQLCF